MAPHFIYKIDHRFPRTRDCKNNGKRYTFKSKITKANCVFENEISVIRRARITREIGGIN